MDNSEKLEQYDYSSESDYFETAVIEYSSYIGEFFMEFSLLEHILNIKIAGVIHHGTHEIGYQVMENMSMKNKIDLFVRLYNNIEESLDKKEKNKLLNIKTILNAINEFRNSLAHAYWYSIQTN